MTELINMTDTYETESGLKVRVACVDFKNPEYPVLALITGETGIETVWCYTPEGRFYSDNRKSEYNLIKVEPIKEIVKWLDGEDDFCATKEIAEEYGLVGAIKLKIQNNKLIGVEIVE